MSEGQPINPEELVVLPHKQLGEDIVPPIDTNKDIGAGDSKIVEYIVEDQNPESLENSDASEQVLEISQAGVDSPLPQVDPQTGILIDEGGQWAAAPYFEGTNSHYIARHKDEIRFKEGKSKKGQSVTLFNVEDVEALLARTKSHPKVDTTSFVFTDSEGQWATQSYFGRRDTKYLVKKRDQIRTKSGTANNGRMTTVFNVEDAERILQERGQDRQVDPETYIYTNDEGDWGSGSYFGPSDYSYLRIHSDQVRSIKGKGRKGNEALLFNIDDAKKILNSLKDLPQVNPDTNTLENNEGEWGTLGFFGAKDHQYLRNNKEKIRTIRGRGAGGLRVVLFNIDDARDLLAARKVYDRKDASVFPDEADALMRGLEEEI